MSFLYFFCVMTWDAVTVTLKSWSSWVWNWNSSLFSCSLRHASPVQKIFSFFLFGLSETQNRDVIGFFIGFFCLLLAQNQIETRLRYCKQPYVPPVWRHDNSTSEYRCSKGEICRGRMNFCPRMNSFTGIFGCSPRIPPAGGDAFVNFKEKDTDSDRDTAQIPTQTTFPNAKFKEQY
jgi:hypothetical protein